MEVPDVEDQVGNFDSEDNVEHLEEKFWDGDDEEDNVDDNEEKQEVSQFLSNMPLEFFRVNWF